MSTSIYGPIPNLSGPIPNLSGPIPNFKQRSLFENSMLQDMNL